MSVVSLRLVFSQDPELYFQTNLVRRPNGWPHNFRRNHAPFVFATACRIIYDAFGLIWTTWANPHREVIRVAEVASASLLYPLKDGRFGR